MKRRKLFLTLVAIAILIGAQPSVPAVNHRNGKIKFTIRIENISSPDGQTASNGTKWPFALSPGVWALSDTDVPVFKEGERAMMNGLEAQAEDGNTAGLLKSLYQYRSVMVYGDFNTPVGAKGPGPIGPGAAYEITIAAKPGKKLFLALMFGQSNDWFYAPESSIDLFDKSGKPLNGDVTSKLVLWDAGTEKDEEPGIGANQAPRQKAPNTGESEKGVVRKAAESAFYSRTGELFRVTIMPEEKM